MIPRWYSARLVRHWPGSALASELSRRFWSAQSLIVRSGGGFRTASAFTTVRFRIGEPVNLRISFEFNVWLCEIIEYLADRSSDQVPGISDGGLVKGLWCQPVRQRQEAGSQKREDGNPSRLNLIRRNQRAALFLCLHLGKVSPRPNEAGTFSRIIRRTGLRPQRLITQVPDIAAYRPDQVILAALRLRDHTLAAQLLYAPLREI
jgi:hypothetical protein